LWVTTLEDLPKTDTPCLVILCSGCQPKHQTKPHRTALFLWRKVTKGRGTADAWRHDTQTPHAVQRTKETVHTDSRPLQGHNRELECSGCQHLHTVQSSIYTKSKTSKAEECTWQEGSPQPFKSSQVAPKQNAKRMRNKGDKTRRALLVRGWLAQTHARHTRQERGRWGKNQKTAKRSERTMRLRLWDELPLASETEKIDVSSQAHFETT
jgi:hypothetical protein